MNKLEELSEQIQTSIDKLCNDFSLEDISEQTFSDYSIIRKIAYSESFRNFTVPKFDYSLKNFGITVYKNEKILDIDFYGLQIKSFNGSSVLIFLSNLEEKVQEIYKSDSQTGPEPLADPTWY